MPSNPPTGPDRTDVPPKSLRAGALDEIKELAEKSVAFGIRWWTADQMEAMMGALSMNNGERASDASFIATCSPTMVLAILAECSRLSEALARATAVNRAHDYGLEYEDDDGTWRDDGHLVCVDERLVDYFAAMDATLAASRSTIEGADTNG